MSGFEKIKERFTIFKEELKTTIEAVEEKAMEDMEPDFFAKWKEFNKKYLELGAAGRMTEATALYNKFKKENGE